MAGSLEQIPFAEDAVLGDARVELGLHLVVGEVLRPRDEGVDRALRAIAVVCLQRETERPQIVLDVFQGHRGASGEQTLLRFVTTHRVSQEIMGPEVPQLDGDGRVYFREGDERVGPLRDGSALDRRRAGGTCRQERCDNGPRSGSRAVHGA